ncbi:Outer membrane receptor proteins, mostly Fe transport [Chitinophaga rupis]|uniref:Outer membrane receptor proteins, mostly Fe transport n=1 Tax=Chitinophaga rupis TaxID=573321 RepID=A0A1H8A427_9BACT|nr:TonB-dependent receptor [Chitinophaga rupis]SEM64598.1 Outer membrane receptor proteins, mostly Fe transport [Chitinophaga rupis]
MKKGLLSIILTCVVAIAAAQDTTTIKELQQVIVSASRTQQKRSDAPIAISTISTKTIQDTKANRLDQLLNKVSGVFMVSLSNEQHEMSIRQPMTTKSLFLYLEDGIPIRTTGLYNHNALLEMNMAAAKQIEIIRGPASSLYGAEAVGGAVNIITLTPPPVNTGMVSLQANNNGYKRVDLQAGGTYGKWGLVVSGYYANRHDGPVDYSDFHKTALTFRADYKASDKTTWSNSITYIDYYSDMTGSLDSAHFAQKNYTTPYSFTYRKTTALRIRSGITQQWNDNSQTQVTAMFRDNSVKQNPSYYITNNRTNALLANGQLNNSSFNSYLLVAQHQQQFKWMGSKVIGGISADLSPSTYIARYIQINRDGKGNYTNYQQTDSTLSNYNTGISNLASYVHYEMSPLPGLKLVAALRYDFYHFDFDNHLPASASTGAPSTKQDFTRFTPKAGFTYNYKGIGVYANYSQGYVPPQVSELFNSVKVPYLQPQTFFNYEAGGWFSLLEHKLYADWSVYLMNGANEIISVREDDGTFQNQNAGKTRHRGVEYGITYRPSQQWMFRVSATNAKHTFTDYVEKGADVSGNEMSAAPHFISNTEVMYHPAFIKGFRIGMEWQHLGKYWMDNANTQSYSGFDLVNLRTGYTVGRCEVWVNALNLFNKYYSTFASKSAYGYSYNLGDPREWNVGMAFRMGKK